MRLRTFANLSKGSSYIKLRNEVVGMSEVIPHWLTKQADLNPHQIAIETNHNESLTFLQLKHASELFANKLAQANVTKGSHIGLLAQNNVEMVIAIHALSYLGAVVVLLNTKLTHAELSYQLTDAEVSLLLTTDRFYDGAKQIPFNGKVFSFEEINQLTPQPVVSHHEISLSDVFTIIYTSGTTGFPKGVVHTYGNHWWSAMGSALNLGIHKDDTWLVVLPLFHVSGLSTLFKSVIYGMPIVLLDGFNEKIVNDLIFSKKITHLSVVTVMLQRLLRSLGERSYPDYFRTMLLGGGPVPRHLLESAAEKNIPVFQSYGMTETCSQIVTLSPRSALLKIGSAGKPLFPSQLKIINQDQANIGEILVKGPMVATAYYNNKYATVNAFADEWLKTGDMGYLDDEGFLYLVDRRTDLIISGGENIYPSEIESVLSEMKYIDEVGVTKRKHAKWGEVPVAFVVCDHSKLTKKEIIDYASLRLAAYKVPKDIYFIDTLPRNATNKLMRKVLAEQVGSSSNESQL